MKLFSIMVCLLLILLSGTHGKTITLMESGTQKLTVTYLKPDSSEKIRVQFEAKLDANLAADKAVTVYWVKASDSAYTVANNVDTAAFGFSFICQTAGGCTSSTAINASFYGSTINCNAGTCTWKVSNLDVSTMNKGSASITSGSNPTTMYGLDSNWLTWSNIPLVDTTTYLKCWGAFAVDRTAAPLNAQTTVSSISGVQTVNKEVSVKTSELTCQGSTCSSGSLNSYLPSCLLATILMFNLIF